MDSKALNYALARAKEPSTWAGIAIFVGLFGVSEDTISRVVQNGPAVVAAIGALIAIFAPSRKTGIEKTVTSEEPASGDVPHLTE